MTHLDPHNDQAQDLFARKIVAQLNATEDQLPYIVTERLRAAREQAVAQRKRPGAPLRAAAVAGSTAEQLCVNADGTLSLGGGDHGGQHRSAPVWLRRLLTGLPLAALVVALTMIGVNEDQRATVGVAEVDAELLTSVLPPDAYTNPGFLHYLQTSTADAAVQP